MRKTAIIIGLLFKLMNASSQNADEIISKYYEATGGKVLWSKVQSLKYEGHYVMGPGAFAPVNQYIANEISYSDFSWNGMTSKSARNGDKGWSFTPWSGKRIADPMTKDNIHGSKLMSDPQGLLFNYAQKGHFVEYLGTDDFDGTEVHKIKLTTKEGDFVYYYFDIETFYLLKIYAKIKLSDKEQKINTNYSDFKKNEFGIILPYANNWVNEQGDEGGLTQFKKIEVNVKIDDKLLETPGK
ncbi:MAG: hypothetical protein KA797_03555 [Chitinophagales bacterium]|nr:hypothetical protein [Chitinophagales bacterium]